MTKWNEMYYLFLLPVHFPNVVDEGVMQVEYRIVTGRIRIKHISAHEDVSITVSIFQGVVVSTVQTALQNKLLLSES